MGSAGIQPYKAGEEKTFQVRVPNRLRSVLKTPCIYIYICVCVCVMCGWVTPGLKISWRPGVKEGVDDIRDRFVLETFCSCEGRGLGESVCNTFVPRECMGSECPQTPNPTNQGRPMFARLWERGPGATVHYINFFGVFIGA